MYRVDGDGERIPLIVQVTSRAPSSEIDGYAIEPEQLEGLATVLENTGIAFSESLVQRVIREALTSDLVSGRDFEHSSPLASPDRTDVDEFNGSMARIGEGALTGDDYPQIAFSASTGENPVVSLAFDGDTVGALTFHPDAFVIAIDADFTDVEVAYDFNDGGIASAWAQREETAELISDPSHGMAVVWRLYTGEHSNSTDGVSEGWRVRVNVEAVVGPAILVGRMAMFSHGRLRRDKKDPLYPFRRASGEEKYPHSRSAYPAIETVASCSPTAIIAVHGTMAAATDLAAAIVDELGQHRLVLRFEHDTWLPIPENALELVGHIERLGLTRVTFVAHSRGGLVARDAMETLAVSNRVKSTLIALGSPFDGTPIVDGVDGGLLALTALTGMLKNVTGPVGFAANRLAGMLLKFRLPRGIEDMSPTASYLRAFKRVSNDIVAFAGSIDAQAERPSQGLAKNLAHGFATGVFGPVENDYVVAAASSRHLVSAENVTHIESDHFSYLGDTRVKAAIRAIDTSTNVNLVIDD
jgi:pimeloyl-ACP methyl ester carboxylesterase